MSKPYRVHLSVYPLGSSEPAKVLAAIRAAWVGPSWVRREDRGGAWFLHASAEAPFRAGETQSLFSERLSVAIWQRLGRYVKVVVDIASDESDDYQRRELAERDYLKLMRVH